MFSATRLQSLCERLTTNSGASGELGRSREARRALGAYFTPVPLVDFIVADVLGAWSLTTPLSFRPDGSANIVVLDPAAGDGRFLSCVVAWLLDRAVAAGYNAEQARRAIVQRCVIGMEKDAQFAMLARRILGTGAVVHHTEALTCAPELPPVDIVVGNPPYLRSVRCAAVDRGLWRALQGRYHATSTGEWDVYAAFIEQSLQWIEDDGEVGLVVPSRWHTAAFASSLREYLGRRAALRGIVDFGDVQVIPGATTYVSIVFLSRKATKLVSIARYRGGGWKCGMIESSLLQRGPWRLSVGLQADLIRDVAGRAPSLGDIARISKGVGTNADKVFVVRRLESNEGKTWVESKLHGRVQLETALIHRCLRGRDVQIQGTANPDVCCLVPYDSTGKLIEPGTLYEQWPYTAAYLERCREVLEARERGRFRGERFYRFGRPQNLRFLLDSRSKIVIPDIVRSPRAMLDHRGAMVLDSAYVVRLRAVHTPYTLELVWVVLNSPITRWWLGETGICLRGGYLRMKTAYLNSLPLPPLTPRVREILPNTFATERREYFELLRQAYGVPRDTLYMYL